MGLPILECADIFKNVEEGDVIEVSLDQGVITLEKDGKILQAEPVPEFMQALIKEGGLMNYVAEKMKNKK